MARIENHDGKAWRARAEECRAIADTFQNSETREKMYLMAADYERMAENADQRQREAEAEVAEQGNTRRSGATGTSPPSEMSAK
jgi:hypothetical protein